MTAAWRDGHSSALPATEFGGAGVVFQKLAFLAQIHGPRHVWLQSMTPAKLAAAIEPYLPDKTSPNSN